MRYQPDRGTDMLQRGRCSPIDPSLHMGNKDHTSRILIDATIPFEWEPKDRPQVIKLADPVVQRVKERWTEFVPK
jgi:4-hydroxy-3-polyprenylbenzoate decarboxylase